MMKTSTPFFVLGLLLTAGCAVATVDPDAEGEENADLGDGDGNTGGRVVVTSGGSTGTMSGGSSAGDGDSGGTLNTGGLLNTGGTLSTGGESAAGGSASSGGASAGDCIALDATTKGTGSVGTTDAFCVVIDFPEMIWGWRINGAAGRTTTINGEVVATGEQGNGPVPLPGSSPYLVEVTAGEHDYCEFAFW
jgi:hypothetical protein